MINVTDVITAAVRPFDVIVAVLSRANEASSCDATWLSVDPMVEGRRKLLARVAAASGGAMAWSSIAAVRDMAQWARYTVSRRRHVVVDEIGNIIVALGLSSMRHWRARHERVFGDCSKRRGKGPSRMKRHDWAVNDLNSRETIVLPYQCQSVWSHLVCSTF